MKILTGPTFVGVVMMCTMSAAFAQERIRLRGTVERIDGQVLVLKTRYGAPVKLIISDNPEYIATVRSSVAEITPGVFVGSTARQQPDGAQRANEVHIIPDFMRGIGESLNHSDFITRRNITNAGVERIVAQAEHHLLTVKYKDVEKQLIISNDTTVLTFVPGDKSDIKPGVSLFIEDAKKIPGGLLQTHNVIYGRDGLTPPL